MSRDIYIARHPNSYQCRKESGREITPGGHCYERTEIREKREWREQRKQGLFGPWVYETRRSDHFIEAVICQFDGKGNQECALAKLCRRRNVRLPFGFQKIK
jgi:hypothetical protein